MRHKCKYDFVKGINGVLPDGASCRKISISLREPFGSPAHHIVESGGAGGPATQTPRGRTSGWNRKGGQGHERPEPRIRRQSRSERTGWAGRCSRWRRLRRFRRPVLPGRRAHESVREPAVAVRAGRYVRGRGCARWCGLAGAGPRLWRRPRSRRRRRNPCLWCVRIPGRSRRAGWSEWPRRPRRPRWPERSCGPRRSEWPRGSRRPRRPRRPEWPERPLRFRRI